jgi:hypothetical protein
MKEEKKFTLEKLQVAKLKNLKKIIGGHGDDNPLPTLTVSVNGQGYSNKC